MIAEEDVWGTQAERGCEETLNADLDVALPAAVDDQEAVRCVENALAATDGQVSAAGKGELHG